MGSLGSNPRTWWSITHLGVRILWGHPAFVSMWRPGASYVCLVVSSLPIYVGKSLRQLWSFGLFLFSKVLSQPDPVSGVCVPHGDWQRDGHSYSPADTSVRRLSGCPVNVSSPLLSWLFLRPSGFAAEILFLYPEFICSVFHLWKTRLLPSKMARHSFNSNRYWVLPSIRPSARYHEGQAHAKTLCLPLRNLQSSGPVNCLRGIWQETGWH